jgi:5-methylcytosine-specific restriction endonuclease McrA
MLFPYTYVPHQMEKMQTFIDFIFYAVWCQAPLKRPYRLELFASNPELFEVMTAFHYDDSKGAEFFAGHVERIYALFVPLSACQVEQLRLWYWANNDVERVCANDPVMSVKRYADFPAELKDLRDQLASFFKGLYSHVDVAALKKWISDIDGHYESFVKVNDTGKCPFCGINDLLGQYHSKREAYDHYLPKALYPFNSINLRNLVPACHHCNSSYKTSKDPAHTPKDPAGAVQRRAVFYPYATEPHAIELQVSLKHADIPNLKPEDVSLLFGPDEISEEIATWKDVYDIEERYKAKLCTKSDGKAWFAQVVDEWKELGRTPQEFLEAVALGARKRPYTDCTFLKKPFLEACKDAGLFNAKLRAA